MIEAWLSASLMTASSLVRMDSKSPAFASKHDAYRMVSSVPWKAVSRSSSCLWISCVPQMKRTELRPYPWDARLWCAASTSRGWFERPR